VLITSEFDLLQQKTYPADVAATNIDASYAIDIDRIPISGEGV